MKNRGEAERRAEAYLREVERQLAHKPEAVRREVTAGLRDHIAEARRRAAERGEAETEAMDRILAEMDPPETFAEAAADPTDGAAPGAGAAAARRGGARWFALAAAFLLVNTYGVWRWTDYLSRREAIESGPPATEQAAPKGERVLRLRKVEQVDVSPERRLILRLMFSAEPDRTKLTRFLRLHAVGEGPLDYRLMEAMGGEALLIETDPVLTEKMEYVLQAGMPSTGEALPADREERGTLTMDMNMLLRSVEVDSPSFDAPVLEVEFNVAPELNEVKEFVAVEPQTAFTVEPIGRWWKEGFRLRGDFHPGEIYQVTFKEGLPAANGSSLPKDLARTVHVPPRKKAVKVDVPGRYLAPGGALAVPVAGANVERFTAQLRRVYANNLIQLAQRESGSSRCWGGTVDDLTGDAPVVTNFLAPSADGGPVRGMVELRHLTAGEPRGVYWLEVGAPDAAGDSRLLVVTDLGLAVRSFRGGLLAWVNSLSGATPVTNAAVTVYARNNQVLARGVTDEQGKVLAVLPNDAHPFVVVAEAGGDLTYLDLEATGVNSGDTGGAAYLQPGEVEAAVFTERGIYRPGETVFVQAIARDDRMRAPEPFPVLLRVKRPDGRVYRDVPLELDETGAAHGEIRLPEFLPTGRYAFELAMPGTHTVLGRTTAALEDFVPPQIRVDVEAPPERRPAGDVLRFGVRGDHLFGRPAAGLKTTATATFTPAPFAPENWKGWHFGDGEKDFAPIHKPIGAGALDADGRGEFMVDTRKAWRPPAALQVVLGATVMETSGRSVTAYGAAQIDPYPFYVGLRPGWEGAVRAGETQRVAVAEVRPDGEPVAEGKPLILTLSRVTWNSVLRRNREGRYEWTSERQVVEVRQDTLAAGGVPADWAFAVPSPGVYTLAAADPESGTAARIEFWAASSDPSWAAWSREKPGRVELAWDRERYRPGDTARLQVRAPFAGPALLTIETDRIHETRVVELAGNTAELEIAVDEELAPNAWCTLSVIRPAQAEAVWNAHRAIGTLALPVERPDRRMQVELAAPERIRPKTPLAGTVSVRDETGQPARGRVTVLAVDEAICLLTDYETPDPLTVFTARRGLAVSGYDLYSELMPITEERLEGTPAPGGGMGAALRRRLNPIKADRFKPVALWAAALPLDENGQAGFRLEVPEFTGELRLMAVAWDDTRTGSEDRPVTVKRDVVVQPALPRFLAIGDRAQGGAALHNGTGQPVEARIRVSCGGPLRADPPDQTVELPAGGSAQAVFDLEAGPGPGKAVFHLEVEAGTETYRESIELAVRPAAGTRVETVMKVVAPGETVRLEPPAGWLPASLAMSGTLSSLPSAQLGRALDYVVHYPYGCLEQTVSGAFPLLRAQDWIHRLLPSDRALGDVEGLTAAAVARVLSMQQEGGGFALWPFQRGVSDPETLYALHFLVEAQAAGFPVPETHLKAGLDWLRNRLEKAVSPDLEEKDWRIEMGRRAYACQILALAGHPDAGWAARLAEQSGRLDYAARVHTAAALLHAGEPRQAVALMEALPMPAPRARVPGRLLDSEVRDAALLLSAWLEIDPDHAAVPALAQRLRDLQRDGHWGNTQDNALALLAFGKLARRLPDEEQPLSGSVRLPDGTVREFAATNDVSWSTAPGGGGGVEIRNDGPGKAYLCVRYEGVSAEPEPASSQGVAIRREWLDLNGNPIEPDAVRQGDLLVARLTVDPQGNRLDQLVIEDLLPAGLEIENANLATAQLVPWLEKKKKGEGDRHREARDDRMLIFTGPIPGEETAFHYAVRAVTPGTFVLPPPTVAGMYEPEFRGAGEGGELVVRP
ncbi:MAG TPA: MG2 domain-containing protein [Kiritimatiellia bacterium]|nr:MG2 domain-containing protein [Kiritimatiellia bacterium]